MKRPHICLWASLPIKWHLMWWHSCCASVLHYFNPFRLCAFAFLNIFCLCAGVLSALPSPMRLVQKCSMQPTTLRNPRKPSSKYEKEITVERDNLTSNHFEINLWERGLPGLGVTQLPGWSVPTNGWPGAGVCGFGEPEPHRSASLPRPAAPRTDAHGTVGPGKVKDVLSILKSEERLQKVDEL